MARITIANLLQTAQALILDFDGTLVDSNAIKREAFAKCFVDPPEHLEAIMEYCRGNNHTPRAAKFRHVFENILKLPWTAAVEQKMLEDYERHTTEAVIAAPEIPGAAAFLEKWVSGKNSALLSSTPHAILLHILARRKMTKYFRTVQGAPVNKAEWISQFLVREKLKPADVVFIGDSEEDWRCAQNASVPFIGVGEAHPKEVPHTLAHFKDLVKP